ncbi:autotransporter-associated beta strand repeat-containing protein [Verrucomicrobium sp. BvORR034]|uniref:autotransporter-associated beta strand repeat-containing protein n=1 Tax=Verrucomicrobium sp. BvORR034 TaxID=1396418 RepID=UPI0006785E1B|nr:autotransporter-associated beta strand repeat-containing protein [Verrucomicrobium sp. BvORR034]
MKFPFSAASRFALAASIMLTGGGGTFAGVLYNPSTPTDNGFYKPTLDYDNLYYEYSAWDVFYAPHTEGNYPDLFAPWGGEEAPGGGWQPVPRPSSFPGSPVYNPASPLAYWDLRNPTIKQTGTTSTFIIGPDVAGNIYSFQSKTSYMLSDNLADSGTPSANFTQIGGVIFQFQTDGTNVDFSSLRLVWNDGSQDHVIYATEAEYLREFSSGESGSTHWSAGSGYGNRVAIQWDLSDLTTLLGAPVTSYKILWDSESSSMSFQKADLLVTEDYDAGIPHAAIWTGTTGNWTQSANWSLKEGSGLTLPEANGNLRFQNSGTAVVTLNDGHHTVGELIFENAADVTINSAIGQNYRLTSNTGITTRSTAIGTYTINTGLQLGALNFFEINAGTVVMNGAIAGAYGLVKTGQGTLHLATGNSFTGFLALQEGTLRISGNNTYSGATTVLNGRMLLAADAGLPGALGSNNLAIALGADASLFQYVSEGSTLLAELILDGNRTLSRGVSLAAGDFGKRLGAINTTDTGAVISGGITLTSAAADPDNPTSAAGSVFFTAQSAADVLNLTGAITGGSTTKTVTLDGQGTVVYSGANKTYSNATVVEKGRLVIAAGTSHTGNGNYTVKAGAKLQIDGTLGGTGALNMEAGTLGGKGIVQRAVIFDHGDRLAPGNSTGTLTFTQGITFGGGGGYLWELQDVDAGIGTGWDHTAVQGSLTITATSSDRFVISLQSLASNGNSGLVQDFDGVNGLYDWVLLTASSGITGFSADKFSIDLGSFANATSGQFSLSQLLNGDGSTSLVLHYIAVPEPGRILLLTAATAVLLFRRRRPHPQSSARASQPSRDALLAD